MIDSVKSVLVVDDNENNREILIQRLERRNLKVSAAINGRQALEMINNSQFDLVLLDIMMPEMNGYQVLEQLKTSEILHHLPIIVMSGMDDMKAIAHCIEIGAEDYLIKPINNILFNARITAALEKKQLRDQQIHYRKQIEDYNSQLESRVHEQVREISAAQLAIIYAMAKMAEFRDMETGAHLERVRDYCNIITNDLIYNGKYRDILTRTYIENVNDALISKRVYKGARTHQDTMDIILDGRDKHFDPAIVDSFHAREQEFKRIAYAESEEGVYED